MSNVAMTGGVYDECPPLAASGRVPREWTFLERYPELSFIVSQRPAQAKRIEQHYQRVTEFVEHHVAPQALVIDRILFSDPGYYPEQLMRKACEYRLFSMMLPKMLGGAGVHPLAAFMTYEIIATHCVGIANLLGVNGLAIACVLASYDPRALGIVAQLICENERKGIAPFISTCVTEPGAGSDAEDPEEFDQALLHFTAKKVSGGYSLSGTKVFISNGSLALLHVAVAFSAEGGHRPEDMMLFLVPAESKGLTVLRNEKKMGQKVCPASELNFDQVFVPDRMCCRTGRTNETSFAYAGMSNVLGLTRAGVGGFATGVAEAAYRTALKFVRNHDFLGQPMERQQWVRVELADLARRAQLARSSYLVALLANGKFGLLAPLLAYEEPSLPAWLITHPAFKALIQRLLESQLAYRCFKKIEQRQSQIGKEVACTFGDMAKVSCTDLAMENCQQALSLMGKEGLRHEQGAEKLLRDAKLLQIYEGTNQINLLDLVKRRIVRQFAAAS